MQFKSIVAASLVAVAVSAKTNTTVTNGTNSTTTTTPEKSNGASGLIVNAGIVGAFVAGGVALML